MDTDESVTPVQQPLKRRYRRDDDGRIDDDEFFFNRNIGMSQDNSPPPFDTQGGTLVDPSGGNAAGIASQLLRAQFTEWQKTFQPIELSAMKRLSFNNPDILPNAVNSAKETASNTFGTLRGVLDRQTAAVGVIPTEQQQRVGKRLIDLNQAAAIAGAANTARDNVRLQDESILLGAAPNPNIVR